MIDRESVIRQLTQHIARADYIETDWMDCVSVPMLRGALELLKAQEPRVLTLEEAEIFEDGWYWIEYQTIYQTSGIYHLRCHAIYPEGYDFDQPHSYIQMTEGDYGRYWRCWSARPTDEQREATPWEN